MVSGRIIPEGYLARALLAHHGVCSPRPIQAAIKYAYSIQDNQYAWTRNKYKVDPVSGKMIQSSAERTST
jgi:hypothetical protein